MKQDLVLLDLFSGAGGFHLGLERAGFSFSKVYFSEIDKHAIANYKYIFPNAEYIGSVTDVRGRDLGRVDIITFGSPCQDFSLAGKRTGMEGERSVLITEAIRLICECRPRIFIWENVKGVFSSNGGADFWAILAAFANIGGYRLEWQLLNTSWVLPQNRERIYLVGHLAGGSEPGIFPFREEHFGIDEGSTDSTTVRCLSAWGHSGGMHSGMTLIDMNGRNAPIEQVVGGVVDANYHKGPESHYGARTFIQYPPPIQQSLTSLTETKESENIQTSAQPLTEEITKSQDVFVRHRSNKPYKVENISPALRNSDKAEIRIVTYE